MPEWAHQINKQLNPLKSKNPISMKAGVIPYHEDDLKVPTGEKRPAFPQYTNADDQFYRPIDIPMNKRHFIYTPCAPNPDFEQLGYCTSEYPFEKPGFNLMDRSIGISLREKGNQNVCVDKTMGWRTSRCDVCVKEGSAYWEVRVVKGGSTENTGNNNLLKDNIDSTPHLRFGVSRREASLEGPVGFDSYGYGIRDQGLESIHEGKLKHVLKNDRHHLKEGDILSFILKLPNSDIQIEQGKEYTLRRINALRDVTSKRLSSSLSPSRNDDNLNEEHHSRKRHKLNRNTDFHLALLEDIKYDDVVRDNIAIRYKNQLFFESTDYIKTTMPEYYSSDKRERQDYYSLDQSYLAVYLNGEFLGNAFQELNPFLPPFSELQYNEKFYSGYWRNGEYIDDQNEENRVKTELTDVNNINTSPRKGRQSNSKKKGLLLRNKYVNNNKLGYYPTVSCFNGGEAQIIMERDQLQFLDKITPPENLNKDDLKTLDALFMEQIADDIVWDIIDEVEEEVQNRKD